MLPIHLDIINPPGCYRSKRTLSLHQNVIDPPGRYRLIDYLRLYNVLPIMEMSFYKLTVSTKLQYIVASYWCHLVLFFTYCFHTPNLKKNPKIPIIRIFCLDAPHSLFDFLVGKDNKQARMDWLSSRKWWGASNSVQPALSSSFSDRDGLPFLVR